MYKRQVWDNPSATTVSFSVLGNSTRWTSDVGQRVSYFVIAGKTYDEIYEGYRLLSGDVPMLPKSAYGYIQCKQRYTSQELSLIHIFVDEVLLALVADDKMKVAGLEKVLFNAVHQHGEVAFAELRHDHADRKGLAGAQ